MKSARDTLVLIVMICFFIIFEGGIIYGFRGCNFNRIKVDDNNTYSLTVTPDRIEEISGRRGPIPIKIYDGNRCYTLFWQGDYARKYSLRSHKLVKLLSAEQDLRLVLRSDKDTIVALQGKENVYLTMEDYNTFARSNCTTGIIVLSVLQVFILLLFVPGIIVLIIGRKM